MQCAGSIKNKIMPSFCGLLLKREEGSASAKSSQEGRIEYKHKGVYTASRQTMNDENPFDMTSLENREKGYRGFANAIPRSMNNVPSALTGRIIEI